MGARTESSTCVPVLPSCDTGFGWLTDGNAAGRTATGAITPEAASRNGACAPGRLYPADGRRAPNCPLGFRDWRRWCSRANDDPVDGERLRAPVLGLMMKCMRLNSEVHKIPVSYVKNRQLLIRLGRDQALNPEKRERVHSCVRSGSDWVEGALLRSDQANSGPSGEVVGEQTTLQQRAGCKRGG